MRSLFSNRYNHDRKDFYERYEAARRLHPSLPLYERPVEPIQLEINDFCGRRRYRSYRELAHQTREQRENEAWLNSDRMPITVRRLIEERNDRSIMPRYNPTTAQHVFSYNARPKRRGRRPAAITEAKIAADFAIQVGGLVNQHIEIEAVEVQKDQNLYMDGIDDVKGIFEKENVHDDSNNNNNDNNNNNNSNNNNNNDDDDDENENDENDENCCLTKRTTEPKQFEEIILKMDLLTDTDEIQTNKSVLDLQHHQEHHHQNSDSQVNVRLYYCPNLRCSQSFNLRRNLYQHQREKNHHNWEHKCSVCGQVFRKAGFKGMHTDGACQRNLQRQNK